MLSSPPGFPHKKQISPVCGVTDDNCKGYVELLEKLMLVRIIATSAIPS